MSEFGISPPLSLLVLLAVIVVASAALSLVRRGNQRRKLVSLGLVIVASVALALVVYRPSTIQVDENGIAIDGPGAVVLEWQEVRSAVFDTNLAAGSFRPTVRVRGFAIGDFRRGRFLLSNGDEAEVFMSQGDAAVVIRTEDYTYLLAPDEVSELAREIDTFRFYE